MNKTILICCCMLLLCSCHTASIQPDHDHDAVLQLTAYSPHYEVYAEVTPLATEAEITVLAHFTQLSNFKPLCQGRITATLAVGSQQVSAQLDAPTRKGIYKFQLTAPCTGTASLTFLVETPSHTEQLSIAPLTVYANSNTASHQAEAAMITSANAVTFTKEVSWQVDFATEPCRIAPMGQVIHAMAEVQTAQGDEHLVTAGTSGTVTWPQNAPLLGAYVAAGTPLCHIESSTLADGNLALRYAEAENNYRLARSVYERKAKLAKHQIVSLTDLQAAEAAYEQAKATYNTLSQHFAQGKQTIKAPITGYLKGCYVTAGTFVEVGTPIATIAKNQKLLLKTELPAKYFPLLHQIADIQITLPYSQRTYSLHDLNGKVCSYGKSITADAPRIPLLFEIDNTLDLLPGSFLDAYIMTQGTTPIIAVPREAVLEEMGNFFVYVQLTPELFEKRQVTVGKFDGAYHEICSGLQGNERVATRGAVLLKLTHASGNIDAHAAHVH